MLSRNKILIALSFVVVVSFVYCTHSYTQKLENSKHFYYHLGQLEVYTKKIESYFDKKIKIVNFDVIEEDFLNASNSANEVKESVLFEEKYQKYLDVLEDLRSKKDKYKAILSEINMSLMFIKKLALDSKETQKLKIYYTFLEFGIEEKKDFDTIGTLIDDLDDNDIFKSHSIKIVYNLKQLVFMY
jgi:hypothetical protein